MSLCGVCGVTWLIPEAELENKRQRWVTSNQNECGDLRSSDTRLLLSLSQWILISSLYSGTGRAETDNIILRISGENNYIPDQLISLSSISMR